MNFTSKIMGFLRIAVSVLWIGLFIAGIVFGLKGFSWIETSFNQVLVLSSENIGVFRSLLVEVTDVIDNVGLSFGTVERSLIDAGLSLDDSQPMIDKSSTIITQDVPKALDDVQDAMPGVIEAAAMVDQSLTFLSTFQLSIPNPFGADWEFDLGLEYDPAIPLEDAIVVMSANLEGLPDQMRAVETDLGTVGFNMSVISDDLIDIAYNMDQMREQIADINPEMDKIILSMNQARLSLDGLTKQAPEFIDSAQNIYIGFLVLLILSQIPSLYIGYMLISAGFKPGTQKEEDHEE